MAAVQLVCVLIASAITPGVFTLSPDSTTKYVIALLGQDYIEPGTNGSADVSYEFVVTSTTSGIQVTISDSKGLISTMNIGTELVARTTLGHHFALNGSEFAPKALIVESSVLFTLRVFSKRLTYVEGFLAIPVSQLLGPFSIQGVYEYIVTTFCDTGGICQFAIAAVFNDTIVSVVIPRESEEVMFCKNRGLFSSKLDTKLSLDQYEVAQFESRTDLTGTHIYSFQSIVVFAGSRAVMHDEVTAHTVEQLVPSSHWGNTHVVVPLGNNLGDVIKITSNWANTVVKIAGFPIAKLPDTASVIVRRIYANSKVIEANHPIQVVQFTGLVFGSSTAKLMLGMTVVPSIEKRQTSQKRAIVACQNNHFSANFYIVSHTPVVADSLTINAADPTTAADAKVIMIPYSNFRVDITPPDFSPKYDVTSSSLKGIVRCGLTTAAVTPLEVVLQPTTTLQQLLTVPTPTGGVCKEGVKASWRLRTPPLKIPFGTFTVMKLRVSMSGSLLLRFHETMTTSVNSINIQLHGNGARIDVCPGNTCTNQTSVLNAFNSQVADGGVAFFWFRLIVASNVLCVGFGSFPETTGADCGSATTVSYPGGALVGVSIMGMSSSISFTYDLERDQPCDSYLNGWRCEDTITNCSSYGTDFCTASTYQGFAMAKCRKHCGKCSPDSYGRVFKVIIPPLSAGDNALLYVTGMNGAGNVGVATVTRALRGQADDPRVKYFKFSGQYVASAITTPSQPTLVVVYSDVDVTVTVVSGLTKQTYAANPVDTYGTEFMLLSKINEDHPSCFAVSDRKPVDWQYKSRDETIANLDPGVISANKITPSAILAITSNATLDWQSALITGSAAFAIFCGLQYDNTLGYIGFNQLNPTPFWDKTFTVPVLNPSAQVLPFGTKLIIQTLLDNTVVKISGAFNENLAVFDRGTLKEQPTLSSGGNEIVSNYPVQIGICFYELQDATSCKSYTQLPGKSSFVTGSLVSVPDTIMSSAFNRDSLVTYFTDGTSKIASTTTRNKFYTYIHQGTSFGLTIAMEATDSSKWMTVSGPKKFNNFQHSDPPCVISSMEPADKIDNDCDGIVDEEECCFQCDTDLDGRYSEDCSTVKSDMTSLPEMAEPSCLPISERNDSICWTMCTCRCSWQRNYEEWLNMTAEEKEEKGKKTEEILKKVLIVQKSNLLASTSEKVSAEDDRPSSKSIGYLGIAMFSLVFGAMVLMDASALFRDAKTIAGNLKIGFQRLKGFCRRSDR